jgi:nucleotide-binding universal stress UspA family protein
MQHLRQLVVGTDFGASAEAALDTAITLAQLGAARITLVHVCELSHGEGDEDVAERCRLALAAICAARAGCGVEIAPLLRSGRPSDKIHNVAAEVGASLIVIGRGNDVGLGTIAERVLRSARRPVLTVGCDLLARVAEAV